MMRKNITILVSLLILSFTACSDKAQYFEESGSVFHTSYHIKYKAKQILTDKIDSELQRFNLSLNPFNPNSTIAKVNNNEDVEVDEWFTEVFNKAEEISQKSGGAFDITCAPLINLWGFGFSKMDSVTPQMIDSIKAFVGYQKVRLEGKKIIKEDPRILLNCSSIAKGYACDVIARLLEKEGVKNYMVEIGGEVTMKGINQQGDCWRVGINKPEIGTSGVTNDVEEIVQLCQKGGVATSGDYRNFYIKDGKKYAHTINPATGYPAGQNILSATIVAEDCMTADAYATTFMVLGVEKAKLLAQSIPQIEYFIIYADNNGNTEKTIEPTLLKKTVSENTSATLKNYLQNVVANGTGKVAKVDGYSMGGKTGTAQMYDETTHLRKKGSYLVSFIGCVPAQDPQLVIYTVIDQPNVQDQPHSNYAQNLTREILKEVLPYMNIYPDEEQTGVNADLTITGTNPPTGEKVTQEGEQGE